MYNTVPLAQHLHHKFPSAGPPKFYFSILFIARTHKEFQQPGVRACLVWSSGSDGGAVPIYMENHSINANTYASKN